MVCCHFLVITNNAATNIHLQVFVSFNIYFQIFWKYLAVDMLVILCATFYESITFSNGFPLLIIFAAAVITFALKYF